MTEELDSQLDVLTQEILHLDEDERTLVAAAAAHTGASVAAWCRDTLLRAADKCQKEAEAAARHAALLEDLKRWQPKPETAAYTRRREKQRRDREAGKILSANKVAKLLRLSAPTVIRLMRNGTIPAQNHGSWWFCHRADIDAMFRHPNWRFRTRLIRRDSGPVDVSRCS